MDYIKNIDAAVKAFESETKKLSNYTNLLGTIKELIKAIQSEKDILNSSTEEIKKAEEPLFNSYEALKKECDNLKQIIDKEQLDNKTIKNELTALLSDYLNKEKVSRAESVDMIDKTAVKMTLSVTESNQKLLEVVNSKANMLEKQISNASVEVNEQIVKNIAFVNDKVDAIDAAVKKDFDTFIRIFENQAVKQAGVQNSLDIISEELGGSNKEIASVKMLCITAIIVGIFNTIMLFMLH